MSLSASLDRGVRICSLLLAGLALAFSGAALDAQNAAQVQLYDFVRILPAGATSSRATSVNEHGQVSGWYQTGDAHAFRWSPTVGAIPWGEPPGVFSSHAYDLNRLGIGTGEAGGPVLWSGVGSLFPLPVLPGHVSAVASGMNNRGRVVGSSSPAANDTTGWIWHLPFGTRDLRALGVPSARSAIDINERNQIVGSAGSRAYRFDLDFSALTVLGTLGGDASEGLGINNLGHVVGWARTPSATLQPFLWTPAGGMKNLGNLTPAQPRDGKALALNDSGQVVGESGHASGLPHAFLWDSERGLRDLNGIVPARGSFVLVRATHVSQDGWIAGEGRDSAASSAPIAFVLRPR